MKNFILLFAAVLLLSMQCEKEQSNEPPEMPGSETYDFNNDEVDDFTIEYQRYTWDGRGISGDGQSGTIAPLNGNMILANRDELGLFNEIYDTIQKDVALPLEWISVDKILVIVQNSSDNDFLWPDHWSVLSNQTGPEYYLGLMINDQIPQIGWIKLKITPSSGVIEITDKEFVEGDFIMINR